VFTQALGQCSEWISTHLPYAKIIPTESTAKAAELVCEDEQGASICSLVCAELFKLKVIAKSIQNQSDNTTRFLVLGKENVHGEVSGPHGTLISCTSVDDINRLLGQFITLHIPIIRIDTRPTKGSLWYLLFIRNYVYFIEFRGHYQDEVVYVLFGLLKQICKRVQLLGSYPLHDVIGIA
jgi:chorismate mutase / prephenate dehydratase